MPWMTLVMNDKALADRDVRDRFDCVQVRLGARTGKTTKTGEPVKRGGTSTREGPLEVCWSDGAREPLTAKLANTIEWLVPTSWMEGAQDAPAAADEPDVGSILAKCPAWARSTVARSLGVSTAETRAEDAKVARVEHMKNVGAIVSGRSTEPLKPVAGNPGSANAAPALSKADRVKQLQQIGKTATAL